MYTLKLQIWYRDKYGDPDEDRFFGEYFSEEAAQKDAETLEFNSMFNGWSRVRIRVCEKKLHEVKNEKE